MVCSADTVVDTFRISSGDSRTPDLNKIQIAEKAEIVVHRLVDEAGRAIGLAQPRAGNLAVPLQQHADAVGREQMSGEGASLAYVLCGLPGQSKHEGEVRLAGKAVGMQQGGGVLQNLRRGALADLLQSLVVAAFGADQELTGEFGDRRHQTVIEQIGRAGIVDQ